MQRISDFVEDAKSGMIKHEFRRGCLVGNLGQEIVVLPDSFRCELENILLDWQERLAACLRLAVQQEQIPSHSDCDELAAFFWIGWEGAVLRAKLVQDVGPLDTFFRGFVAGIQK
ncbi:transcriptional regulator, TetR family [Psychrobacter sp. JCM 18901]|uniref:TetR family transcriptional regulator C-terminal domain-containing protein n=1 Tax=Psychrobacter sp. JCM 18901 TaxID=1298609 RepID=UPI000434AB35|nr:TetR family transcriptional regulator C-terminal domain-containing protein [Psychrobacter sp. JCM 18901]GAF56027.1 transcriptional regulator, TetR family [Psychrobacter sp. JCM 18901]